jgi:pSer/pThr/pTyr-binding forkhead associated (FHA) protein
MVHGVPESPTIGPAAAVVPTEQIYEAARVGTRARRLAEAVPRPGPGRYLAVEDGEEVVLIRLASPVTHIGRSPAADIELEDLTVSRRHAVVAIRGEHAVILDDRSANGVWVNDRRVDEAVLRDGDTVRLGRVTLRYVAVPPRTAVRSGGRRLHDVGRAPAATGAGTPDPAPAIA